MVIRIPGFLQGQHEQPGARSEVQAIQQVGPQPGPDPAWARFSVEGGGGSGLPRKVSLRAYKPDVAAYRVLGAAPLPGVRAHDDSRSRNRHNTGVYVTSAEKAIKAPAALRLPVVGEIAAGAYDVTVAFQDYDCLDGGLAVDKAMARGGAYALRVRGTSMTHVGIEPDDYVVIRPQTWADDGDFVVANYVDGEAGGSEGLATLKRFYKRRDHIFLQSATASTDPIRLFASRRDGDPDPVRVQGVVTMVVKAGAGA